jgi:hypothetical protein
MTVPLVLVLVIVVGALLSAPIVATFLVAIAYHRERSRVTTAWQPTTTTENVTRRILGFYAQDTGPSWSQPRASRRGPSRSGASRSGASRSAARGNYGRDARPVTADRGQPSYQTTYQTTRLPRQDDGDDEVELDDMAHFRAFRQAQHRQAPHRQAPHRQVGAAHGTMPTPQAAAIAAR